MGSRGMFATKYNLLLNLDCDRIGEVTDKDLKIRKKF